MMKKEQLETLVLVVDLDKSQNNIKQMADLANHAGVRLRPHVKTQKKLCIAHKQLEAGAKRITVAKLNEATCRIFPF